MKPGHAVTSTGIHVDVSRHLFESPLMISSRTSRNAAGATAGGGRNEKALEGAPQGEVVDQGVAILSLRALTRHCSRVARELQLGRQEADVMKFAALTDVCVVNGHAGTGTAPIGAAAGRPGHHEGIMKVSAHNWCRVSAWSAGWVLHRSQGQIQLEPQSTVSSSRFGRSLAPCAGGSDIGRAGGGQAEPVSRSGGSMGGDRV